MEDLFQKKKTHVNSLVYFHFFGLTYKKKTLSKCSFEDESSNSPHGKNIRITRFLFKSPEFMTHNVFKFISNEIIYCVTVIKYSKLFFVQMQIKIGMTAIQQMVELLHLMGSTCTS